jgi:cytoskeletal protein RodZ
MPLDTGVLAEVDLIRAPPVARRPRLSLDPTMDVGAALRAAREALGFSLDEIEEATRVRVKHLAAIESSDVAELPSRPFAIGYVHAYAKALGLDADAATARYRAEHPSPDDELHSPAGVAFQRAGRNSFLGAGVSLIVVAVVAWNVTRHVMAEAPRRAPATPHAAAPHPAAAVSGPFTAGAPLPAPPEASIPAPYATPGLAAAAAAGGSADAADAAVKAAAASAAQAAPADPNAPPKPFVAQGQIYGPTNGASDLIIQARGPISLEVRGAGGVVYFARQLADGEAYRVPNLAGLTAEVSNPANAELFEAGVSKGPFAQPVIPLKPAA